MLLSLQFQLTETKSLNFNLEVLETLMAGAYLDKPLLRVVGVISKPS